MQGLSLFRRRLFKLATLWLVTTIVLIGVFFLGQKIVKITLLSKLAPPVSASQSRREVFGFAPYWTLSKLSNIDWTTLTTFAYFSLPVGADGTIDKTGDEWRYFNGEKLSGLLNTAKANGVRRVVTLTQMDKNSIEQFLDNPDSWKTLVDDSASTIKDRKLDGVNIDFEYMKSNDDLKTKFSDFVDYYNKNLSKQLDFDPYVTVSVIASSVKDNKIYDIGKLSKATDAIFMMAYDFYYPGSNSIGPSAPLYGYDSGKGPFWYDVSTAVSDFLKNADSSKIILGVPYYGWNYPAYSPSPKTDVVSGSRGSATTQAKMAGSSLMSITPMGGWDDAAKVSWRGYWDNDGWHVVYMEDERSLGLKFDFAKDKKLAGVGIWALGYDNGSNSFWKTLKEKFGPSDSSTKKN